MGRFYGGCLCMSQSDFTFGKQSPRRGLSSAALPPPTADGLPDAMQPEAEDDTAGILGLDSQPEQAAKKRRLSGPKLKKSREELMEEEVEKLQAKLAELLNSMKDPTQPMPTAAAVAKLQRVVGGKMVEAKEAGAYQVSTQPWRDDLAIDKLQGGIEVHLVVPTRERPPEKEPRRQLRRCHAKVGQQAAEQVPGYGHGTLCQPSAPEGQAARVSYLWVCQWHWALLED